MASNCPLCDMQRTNGLEFYRDVASLSGFSTTPRSAMDSRTTMPRSPASAPHAKLAKVPAKTTVVSVECGDADNAPTG